MQPETETSDGGAQLTGADGAGTGGVAGSPHLSVARQGDGEDRSARQRRPGEGDAGGEDRRSMTTAGVALT
jgi:hypothetical protein